ncbi:hypothetical protein ACQKWADRAFT_296225 [Trichoderma austrokoningii]
MADIHLLVYYLVLGTWIYVDDTLLVLLDAQLQQREPYRPVKRVVIANILFVLKCFFFTRY